MEVAFASTKAAKQDCLFALLFEDGTLLFIGATLEKSLLRIETNALLSRSARYVTQVAGRPMHWAALLDRALADVDRGLAGTIWRHQNEAKRIVLEAADCTLGGYSIWLEDCRRPVDDGRHHETELVCHVSLRRHASVVSDKGG